MANTEYEHAGNADLLRELQQNDAARCELCHYANGTETTSTTIELQPVVLPGDVTALFCQLCVSICKMANDEFYETASKMIRELPPESAAANRAWIAEIIKDRDVSEKEDLTNY